jgi:hypothetical protein
MPRRAFAAWWWTRESGADRRRRQDRRLVDAVEKPELSVRGVTFPDTVLGDVGCSHAEQRGCSIAPPLPT